MTAFRLGPLIQVAGGLCYQLRLYHREKRYRVALKRLRMCVGSSSGVEGSTCQCDVRMTSCQVADEAKLATKHGHCLKAFLVPSHSRIHMERDPTLRQANLQGPCFRGDGSLSRTFLAVVLIGTAYSTGHVAKALLPSGLENVELLPGGVGGTKMFKRRMMEAQTDKNMEITWKLVPGVWGFGMVDKEHEKEREKDMQAGIVRCFLGCLV